MLYIFHVDTGTMLTFNMNIAMDMVSHLQTEISQVCHISEDKQVLLISGGESLDPAARVCSYSAGTDTNPIYLFSKSTIEAATPPSPSVHYGSDIDLQEQVEGSLIMPPAYETVVSRAQLALQLHEVDREELRACDQLVHDQHLQQQGWAAVVANLDDITSALNHRVEIFQDAYADYLNSRDSFLQLLIDINDVISLLKTIPLLSVLWPEIHDTAPNQTTTLYDWISSQDSQHSMDDMVKDCLKVTQQFDREMLEGMKSEVEQTFEAAVNKSMKEVKGLEDRLYGLDQIMSGARRLVSEQGEMTQGFVQNQARAGNLRDASILPDLCASHKKQLLVMLSNHRKLRDIKKKCRLAKEELSINLHTRLRWVMFVEKKICDLDGRLMIYHENLKRLRKRLDILLQIQIAPEVYAQLVVEVVRRRSFSNTFTQWATCLAGQSKQVHVEEIACREKFLLDIGKHFLQALFEGFEDMPPEFATLPPAAFDDRLPSIHSKDLESLQSSVPAMSEQFSLPPPKVSLEEQLWYIQAKASDTSSDHEILQESITDIDIISHSATAESSATDQADRQPKISPPSTACADLDFTGPIWDKDTEEILRNSSKQNAATTDFPIPQSLSDKLTEEMNNQPFRDSTQSVTVITGSASDSSSSVIEEGNQASILVKSMARDSTTIAKRNSTKSDTSPENDMSQEFSTADFYIDESLPSSIADSKVSSDKTELTKLLQEKAENILKLESQLRETQIKLSRTDTQLASLYEIIQRDVPRFKSDLSDFHISIETDRSSMLDYVTTVFSSISDNYKLYENRSREMHAEELNKINTMRLRDKENYEQQLCVNQAKLDAITDELLIANTSLSDANSNCDRLKLEYETQLHAAEENFAKAHLDVVKQHELELEVEMDKIRADLQSQLCEKETEVKDQQVILSGLEERLLEMEKERETYSEAIAGQFAREKDELVIVMQAEMSAKQEETMQQHISVLKKAHSDALELCNLQFEACLNDILSSVQVQHELELLRVVDTMSSKKSSSDSSSNIHRDDGSKVESQCSDRSKCCSEDGQKVCEMSDLSQSQLTSSGFGEELEKCRETLQHEHALVIQTLSDKFSVDKEEAVSQCTDRLDQEKCDSLQQLREQHTLELSICTSELTECKAELHECRIELEKCRVELSKNQADKDEEIETVRQTLLAEKQIALTSRREDLQADREEYVKEQLAQKMEQFQHRTLETEAQLSEYQEQIKQQVWEEAFRWQQANMDRLKDEHLLALRSSLTAEQQVKFNEAVMRVTAEKERLAEELQTCKTQILQLQNQEHITHIPDHHLQMSQDMSASKQLCASTMSVASMGSSHQHSTEMSMFASTFAATQDKVSICSCSIGDIVLLCLDERHDQYVVFSIGSTLHFLHSDCHEALGLKTASARAEPRKSWVLAEVTDKEYCQAKKPQNRFKVPMGTKFYRVKAKPWSRDIGPSPKKSVLPSSTE